MKALSGRKKTVLRAAIIALLLLALVITAGAYYEKVYSIKGISSIEINLLFDNLSTAGKQKYRDAYNQAHPNEPPLPTDPNALENRWGHVGNPYVISDKQHVKNLSFLQNAGFFEAHFPDLTKKPADGYDRDSIPHFLLCDREGNALMVDCSDLSPIDAVGTDAHPFYGSVQGFGSGSTTLNGVTYPGAGFHNVRVNGSGAAKEIDIGLFGKVGCLGYVRTNTTDHDEFNGIPSSLENLIFSDVQVNAVGNASGLGRLHTWLKDLFTVADPLDAGESNHLGILAGHLEYANVKNLSVYYSKPGIHAINLKGGGGNFVCSTGFFGLMDNMNPKPGTTGPNMVQRNSGLNDSKFANGIEGDGGLTPGIMPGYIRAQEVYDEFSATEGTNGKKIIIEMKDKANNNLASDAGGGKYYFADGVFTFALSADQSGGKADTIEDIWPTAEKTPEGKAQTVLQMLAPGSLETGSQTPDLQVPQNEAQEEEGTVPNFTTPPVQPDRETTVPLYLICQPQDMALQIWTLDAQGEKRLWPSEAEKQTLLEAYPAQREYRLVPGTYYLAAQRQGYIPLEATTFQVYPADLSQQGIKPQKIRVTLEEQIPETTGETTPPTVPETTAPAVPETTTATVPETTEAVIPEETQSTLQETVPSKASAAILSNQDLLSLATDPTAAPAENGLGIAPFKVGAPKAPKKNGIVKFQIQPADLKPEVVVKKSNGEVQQPTQGKQYEYSLAGKTTYNYEVKLNGYNPVSGEFRVKNTGEITPGGNISKGNIISVAMVEAPKTITFNCKPADLTISVTDQNGSPVDYKQGLLGGVYSYTASKPGYKTVTGTLNVPKVSGPITETVTLEAKPVTVNFTGDHPGLAVKVFQNGQEITAVGALSWSLMPGDYTYSATCPGYLPIQNQSLKVVPSEGPVTVNVTGWQPVPTYDVTFTCEPQTMVLTVKDSQGVEYTPDPQTGASRGLKLPEGSYTWSGSLEGYTSLQQQFRVTAQGPNQVTAELTETPKTVTFHCTPGDLTLVVQGQTPVPGNPYQYSLHAGTYEYTATPKNSDYEAVSGQLVLGLTPLQKTVEILLPAAPQKVSFASEIQGLQLTVYDDQGREVEPVTPGTMEYLLRPGVNYTYSAHCKGYRPIENQPISADLGAPKAVTVKMDPIPMHKMTFRCDPQDLHLEIWTGPGRTGQQYAAEPGSGTERTCTMEEGTYYWSASRLGYTPKKDQQFTADSAKTLDIRLDLIPKYPVRFFVTPKTAVFTLRNGEGEILSNQGKDPYVYQLTDGTYTWTAEERSGSYASAEGKITVAGAAPEDQQITLDRVYDVEFRGDMAAQGLTVTVYPGTKAQWTEGQHGLVLDKAPHAAKLKAGQYCYKAVCPGYRDGELVDFTVQDLPEKQVYTVQLTPLRKVTFTSDPAGLKHLKLEVRQGTQWNTAAVVAPAAENPLEYLLEDGDYLYRASCFGYEDVLDQPLSVAGQDLPVTVTMKARPKVKVYLSFTPANLIGNMDLLVRDPDGELCTPDADTDNDVNTVEFTLCPGDYSFTATPKPSDSLTQYTEGTFQVLEGQQAPYTIPLTLNEAPDYDPMFPHSDAIVTPPVPKPITEDKGPVITLSNKWIKNQLKDADTQYHMYLEEIHYSAGYQFKANERYFITYSPSNERTKFLSLKLADGKDKQGNIDLGAVCYDTAKVSRDKSQITLNFSTEQKQFDAYYNYGLTIEQSGTNCTISQKYPYPGFATRTYLSSKKIKDGFLDLGRSNVLLMTNNAAGVNWQIRACTSINGGGGDYWGFYRDLGNELGNNRARDCYLKSDGNIFSTLVSSASDDSCTLRIYRVVGFNETSEKIGYEAVADDQGNQPIPINAKDYVLKVRRNADGTYDPYAYDLISFQDLNWRMRGGASTGGDGTDNPVWRPTKFFNIRESAQWGVGVHGEYLDPKSSGIIEVPIGRKDGPKSFIPTGTLAFHVNKLKLDRENRAPVKIIVKVPVTSQLDSRLDNTLGIWKGESQQKNAFWGLIKYSYIAFNKDVPTKQHAFTPISKERFNSQTDPRQDLGREVTEEEYQNHFITVYYEGQPYKTCLQGETVLLAAEFDLNQVGGNINWNTKEGFTFVMAETNYPLQLVYCTADGIASTTRDGRNGSSLGTIDYVYDNGGSPRTVVPVTQLPGPGDPPIGELPENAASFSRFYYPSNLLLRFNNLPVGTPQGSLPVINDEVLDVQRTIDQAGDKIDFTVNRGKGWTGLQGKDVHILGGQGKKDDVIKKP